MVWNQIYLHQSPVPRLPPVDFSREFLIQPPRDASLGPARDLGAEFARLHKEYRGKVWPDTLSRREAGHCFGGDAGDHVWAGEAVAFFDSVLARKARQTSSGGGM